MEMDDVERFYVFSFLHKQHTGATSNIFFLLTFKEMFKKYYIFFFFKGQQISEAE
jgi:hypothetical protein